MTTSFTIGHVISFDDATLTPLLAIASQLLKGIETMNAQETQLAAQITALQTTIAESVANSDKLMSAVHGAAAQITALSAQIAELHATTPAVDLQPALDSLAQLQQTLTDATAKDAAPAAAPVTPAPIAPPAAPG